MIHHDPLTSEPYIRLPPPLSHIILTPPRLDLSSSSSSSAEEQGTPTAADVAAITTTLNDPLVFPWLESPPYPYLPEHADSIIRAGYAEAQQLLKSAETEKWVDGCPFRDIRDTSSSCLPTGPEGNNNSDESDDDDAIQKARKIGDFKIARYAFYEFAHGSAERRDAQRRNEALKAGDGMVEWGVGCISPFSPLHEVQANERGQSGLRRPITDKES